MISKFGIFLSKTIVIQECAVAGRFSLLLCLLDSRENEIYHSWMTELDNNVVNKRSLWILLFPLLPKEWKFIKTTIGKKNMIIKWLLPTPPILLPHPELISPLIYQRVWEGRIQRLEDEKWITAREMNLSYVLPFKPSNTLPVWLCAECITSTLILHNNPMW